MRIIYRQQSGLTEFLHVKHENIETATEEEKETIPSLKKRKTALGASAAKATVSTRA